MNPTDIIDFADSLRRGDPDRFLSTMAAPVHMRQAMFILYTFNLEISRIPWITQETMIAEMRLQWWHDIITASYENTPIKGHALTSALDILIKRHDLPRECFVRMITARQWDIYKKPHINQQAFDQYIYDTAGNLMLLIARTQGIDHHMDTNIRNYGYADGLARLFLAIPALESSGRRPLINNEDSALKKLATHGLLKSKVDMPRHLRPALRSAWMTRPILRKVINNPKLVTQGALEFSDFSKKIRLFYKSIFNQV